MKQERLAWTSAIIAVVLSGCVGDTHDLDAGVDAAFLGYFTDATEVQDAAALDADAVITLEDADVPADAAFCGLPDAGIVAPAWQPTSTVIELPSLFDIPVIAVSVNNAGEALLGWQTADRTRCDRPPPCFKVYVSERKNAVWRHPTIDQPHLPSPRNRGLGEMKLDDCGRVLGSIGDIPVNREIALDLVERENNEWRARRLSLPNAYGIRLLTNARGDSLLLWEERIDFEHSWLHALDARALNLNPDPLLALNAATSSLSSQVFEGRLTRDGEAVVFWNQGLEQRPRSATYFSERVDGVWRHPQSSAETFFSSPPLRVKSAGTNWEQMFVVWIDEPQRAFFLRERASGVWGDTVSFGFSSSDVRLHAAASNTRGDAVIIWSSSGSLYASVRDAGRWIHPGGAFDALGPHASLRGAEAAISDDGYILVVWPIEDVQCPPGHSGCGRLVRAERIEGVWERPQNTRLNVGGVFVGPQSGWLDLNTFGEALIAWVEVSTTAVSRLQIVERR